MDRGCKRWTEECRGEMLRGELWKDEGAKVNCGQGGEKVSCGWGRRWCTVGRRRKSELWARVAKVR